MPVRLWPDPFTLAHGDVLLVDSIAAWLVAPWAQRAANRRRPLAAILGQPPGGIDNNAARRRIQAVLDRNLYRRCGLLIAASESYGEALAAGLPVVGWRAGNLPHLISDGVEGVVLDPGDIPALAAALDRLASDELWRAAVARAAGRRGAALPRWSHTAATLVAAVKELTASAR